MDSIDLRIQQAGSSSSTEKRVTVQKFHKVVELQDALPSETIMLKHFDRLSPLPPHEPADPHAKPPHFMSDFKDLHVQGGEKAEFSAPLIPTVDPNLQLHWTHNGQPLDLNNRRIQTSFALGLVRLIIIDVRLEDAGVYICQAVNSAGEAVTAGALSVTSRHEYSHSYRTESVTDSTQQLNQRRIVEEKTASHSIERIQTPVPQPPRFMSAFERVRVEEGSNAHVHARLSPTDRIHIQWLKNGAPLVISERLHAQCGEGYVALNIYCARLSDAGQYTCIAANEDGKATLDAIVEGKKFIKTLGK